MPEEMKPDFVFDPSETPEEPEIFSVTKETGAHVFNRRRFIETSAVAAAGVVLTSCVPAPSKSATDPNSGSHSVPNVPPVQNDGALESDTNAATSTNTPSPAPTNTPQPANTELPADTKVPTDTKAPLAATHTLPGQTLPGNVFLRSGPATYYPPVTKLSVVTHFVVIGRIPDNTWLHVRLNNGTEGWLYAILTNVKADFLSDIQIDEAPPTPTPLPGTLGNTAPGTTGINYSYKDNYGNTFAYSLPCGSEIPAGAVCTCNCVTVCACDGYDAATPDTGGSGGGGGCSCDSHGGGKSGGCPSYHYWHPNG